eukprot:TRINITY_DN3163_c0_g1_i1.p1 TRINITY_DN3163_c0_g1~~TRINITY_DN3163_c0_g1_i1.p1  ORF type:complete len:103 (-),score=11.54 TRINITY_DN3163_c0_g1_i1:102-410(-)
MSNHTIILIQSRPAPSSRTYHDYNSVPEAMDGLCKIFETNLKQQNPTARHITYEIKDLWGYIDSLPDLGILVFSPQKQVYEPHPKEWAKEKVLGHLKKLATQ